MIPARLRSAVLCPLSAVVRKYRKVFFGTRMNTGAFARQSRLIASAFISIPKKCCCIYEMVCLGCFVLHENHDTVILNLHLGSPRSTDVRSSTSIGFLNICSCISLT